MTVLALPIRRTADQPSLLSTVRLRLRERRDHRALAAAMASAEPRVQAELVAAARRAER